MSISQANLLNSNHIKLANISVWVYHKNVQKNIKSSSVSEPNYCSNCGTKLPKGADFCPKCGKPINKGESYKSVPEKKENKISGIGGWLTFFIISVLISLFAVSLDIYRTITQLDPETAVLILPIVFLEVAIVALYLLFIFRLSSVKKVVVTYAKSFLVLTISLGVYGLLLSVLFYEPDGASSLGELTSVSLRNIAYGSIWLIYFIRSQRVKNTFVK